MIKRVICVLIAAFMFIGLVACGSNSSENTDESSVQPSAQPTEKPELKPAEMKGEISFWHFNKDEGPKIVEAFNKVYPNIKVNLTIVPDKDQNYINKITAAIRSGSGVPDVFSGESAFVRKLVEMEGAYADISDRVKPLQDDIVKYTLEVGTDVNGKIKALSHQITAGGLAYKKPVAKKYLGTDDPEKIAEMLSTPEKCIETAKTLKEKSGGKVSLFPVWEEPYKMFLGSRATGWVKDNKLVIDPKMSDFIDYAKQLNETGGEAGLQQWNPPWAAAIGDDETAMCWAVPTWGVPWIVGSNDKKAADGGRWGLVKAPLEYFWGGTWYGIYAKSEKQDLAWEFIKWFTTDKDHLREWSKSTGDIPSSLSLLEEGSKSSDVDKIMGINLYKFYVPFVNNINGGIFTQYDSAIEQVYTDTMRSYLAGKLNSKEDFLKQFKETVKTNLKDIEVN